MDSPVRARVGSDASVDTWRLSVPSRMDRTSPFDDEKEEEEDSEFPLRASTRLTFRALDGRRPASRLSIFTSRPSIGFARRPLSRAVTALGFRDADEEDGRRRRDRGREWLKGIFGQKRKREAETEDMSDLDEYIEAKEPLRLNFLFVGGRSSGQTSLLFRARYGCCPDVSMNYVLSHDRKILMKPLPQASGIARTCYETYTNERVYDDQPAYVEM
ncbi:hypothetical protein CC79DRAFT_838050 [Sarocladium strictum]